MVDIEIRDEATPDITDPRRPSWLLKALTAAAVILLLGGTVLALDREDETITADTSAGPEGSDSVPAAAPAGPVAVIESYGDAYNSGDIDAVMAFFTDESVILGHPLSDGRAEGLPEIRSLQNRDISFAADADAYSLSNLELTGNTVTWDHNWTNNVGQEWCAAGNSAVVDNGIITSWTWPSAALCSSLSDVIEFFAEAYNSGDIDAVMAFFSDESVIIDHPLDITDTTTRAEGLAEIRSLQNRARASAADADAYLFSNFDVTGNTVMWDHIFTNNVGQKWCGAGLSAVVDNSIITSWTWPTSARCP